MNMRRSLDWPGLVLWTALLFGGIVRFWPVVSNGFPLNDGGMFAVMIRDLKAGGYLLPAFTTYNLSNIPFTYPPLGFYAAALVSDVLRIPEVQSLLWLPVLVNTLCIPAFYKLAETLLQQRMPAALAALVFALSPRSFVWQVMGGGITRSFGVLFLLLMMRQAVLLFRAPARRGLLLTILFGAAAVLSHPQTALHAALGGLLVFLFFGRSRSGILHAAGIGLGTALLVSPWMFTVLTRHGLDPFRSAAATSPRTLEAYLEVLRPGSPGEYLFIPVLLCALWGALVVARRREYVLPLWAVLAVVVDPRGGEGIALYPLAMLAGTGLFSLSARRDSAWQEPRPFGRAMLPGLALYLLIGAAISDFQLLNTSLKPAHLEMLRWVDMNIEDGREFLVFTGREFSMSDPLQEWFPALTGQHSISTIQGLEWTLGERFFPWYEKVSEFQACADADCIHAWASANRLNFEYLVVALPSESARNTTMADLPRGMAESLRGSDEYRLLYESGDALVFQHRKQSGD